MTSHKKDGAALLHQALPTLKETERIGARKKWEINWGGGGVLSLSGDTHISWGSNLSQPWL